VADDGTIVRRESIVKLFKLADLAKPEPMTVTVVPTAAFADGLITPIVGELVITKGATPEIPVVVT